MPGNGSQDGAQDPARRRDDRADRNLTPAPASVPSPGGAEKSAAGAGDAAELVQAFVHGLPAKVSDLRAALSASDWKTFDAAVRRLAGTAGSYGLDEVYQAAEALEGAAAVRDAGGAKPLLDRLTAAVSQAVRAR